MTLAAQLRAEAQELLRVVSAKLAEADRLDQLDSLAENEVRRAQSALEPAERTFAGCNRAVEFLDEKPETIRSARRRGALVAQRVGRCWIYRESDLRTWRLANLPVLESSEPVSTSFDQFRPIGAGEETADDLANVNETHEVVK